jgi:hypothetical protein
MVAGGGGGMARGEKQQQTRACALCGNMCNSKL